VMRRLAATLLLAGLPLIAQAGHGLINSFAGIEWLPEPGMTPRDFGWRADCWMEELQVLAASTPEDIVALRQAQAMERLAEAVRLVKDDEASAAQPAIAAYAARLEDIAATMEDIASEARTAARLAFAARLLEAQYIVSTEYLDLPRTARTALAQAVEAARAAYLVQRAPLSRHDQESLFFREEEVRWSWEQAQAADAQGL